MPSPILPMKSMPAALGALLTILLLAAPAADAAKVKIGGGSVRVTESRVAAIGLANPNRSAAKGTLTLKWQGAAVGRKSFKIPARAARQVKVRIAKGAYEIMKSSGSLRISASAKAKGKGTSSKSLKLTPPAAGGTTPQPGGGGGGGGSSSPWVDGRYQGTYAENNSNLSFNVVNGKLFTGPFDSFYMVANCKNVDPGYTGPNQEYTDTTAMEPIEATVGGDGRFSGSGRTFRAAV